MATIFVELGAAASITGIGIGAYLKLCFAIRREDRVRGSLRFDAPNSSAQAARVVTGMSSSRWT